VNWHSSEAFFAMGGYALYVWGAYGVTALCLAAELLGLARRLRRRSAATRQEGGT
jgi:heme exporter protein D